MLNVILFTGRSKSGKSFFSNMLSEYTGHPKFFLSMDLKLLLFKYFRVYFQKDRDWLVYMFNTNKEFFKIRSKDDNIWNWFIEITGKDEITENDIEYVNGLVSQYHLFETTQYGKEKTMRKIIQYVGTDIGRRLDENLWIKLFDKRVKEYIHKHPETKGFIVDDVRFLNEYEYFIREFGNKDIDNKNVKLVFIKGYTYDSSDKHISETGIVNLKEYASVYIKNKKNAKDFLFDKLINELGLKKENK